MERAELLCPRCCDRDEPDDVLYMRYPLAKVQQVIAALSDRLGPAAADVQPLDLDAVFGDLLLKYRCVVAALRVAVGVKACLSTEGGVFARPCFLCHCA